MFKTFWWVYYPGAKGFSKEILRFNTILSMYMERILLQKNNWKYGLYKNTTLQKHNDICNTKQVQQNKLLNEYYKFRSILYIPGQRRTIVNESRLL